MNEKEKIDALAKEVNRLNKTLAKRDKTIEDQDKYITSLEKSDIEAGELIEKARMTLENNKVLEDRWKGSRETVANLLGVKKDLEGKLDEAIRIWDLEKMTMKLELKGKEIDIVSLKGELMKCKESNQI